MGSLFSIQRPGFSMLPCKDSRAWRNRRSLSLLLRLLRAGSRLVFVEFRTAFTCATQEVRHFVADLVQKFAVRVIVCGFPCDCWSWWRHQLIVFNRSVCASLFSSPLSLAANSAK